MTTKKYLNNLFGEKEGVFVQKTTGKILGKHDGYWQFTIGQRKGIGLAAPEALYVIEIEPETNTVYVGYKNELFVENLTLKNVHWSYPQKEKSFESYVKIRYNMQSVKAFVTINTNNITVSFKEPVSGLTPGQACVFYDINDKHLLGGGYYTK